MHGRNVGRFVVMALVAGSVVAPGAAWAGGFATVGLGSTPEGVGPGEPWVAELTVLQHGRTPMEGLRPWVVVAKEGGGVTKTFPAVATGEPGGYRARVVFPSAGRWTYVVHDSFTAQHSFGPVRIAEGGATPPRRSVAPAAVADDGSSFWSALGAAALAGLAAGLVTMLLQRRRGGDAPAPARG